MQICFDKIKCFGGYTTPAREKLQPCESFPTSSVCCRGSRRFDPERRDLRAPSLSSSSPWNNSHCVIDTPPTHTHIHIHQDRTVQSLTHSTRLPSSEPSSPPLGNLRAQLHSSRYFCLWHGTHSRSYTELAPDPPDTSTGRTCQSSGCVLNAPTNYRMFQCKQWSWMS